MQSYVLNTFHICLNIIYRTLTFQIDIFLFGHDIYLLILYFLGISIYFIFEMSICDYQLVFKIH